MNLRTVYTKYQNNIKHLENELAKMYAELNQLNSFFGYWSRLYMSLSMETNLAEALAMLLIQYQVRCVTRLEALTFVNSKSTECFQIIQKLHSKALEIEMVLLDQKNKLNHFKDTARMNIHPAIADNYARFEQNKLSFQASQAYTFNELAAVEDEKYALRNLIARLTELNNDLGRFDPPHPALLTNIALIRQHTNTYKELVYRKRALLEVIKNNEQIFRNNVHAFNQSNADLHDFLKEIDNETGFTTVAASVASTLPDPSNVEVSNEQQAEEEQPVYMPSETPNGLIEETVEEIIPENVNQPMESIPNIATENVENEKELNDFLNELLAMPEEKYNEFMANFTANNANEITSPEVVVTGFENASPSNMWATLYNNSEKSPPAFNESNFTPGETKKHP